MRQRAKDTGLIKTSHGLLVSCTCISICVFMPVPDRVCLCLLVHACFLVPLLTAGLVPAHSTSSALRHTLDRKFTGGVLSVILKTEHGHARLRRGWNGRRQLRTCSCPSHFGLLSVRTLICALSLQVHKCGKPRLSPS